MKNEVSKMMGCASLKGKWVDWRVKRILASQLPFSTRTTEDMFSRLQASTPRRDVSKYGYDPYSLWIRACERSQEVLNLPGLNLPGRNLLEVGAGDGTLASLLSHFGHHVVLSDESDWRHGAARQLKFFQGPIEDGLPMEDGSFDISVSFNSFEHFADPLKALQEMQRLTKTFGLIYLHFGPLYNSPWGLHAYRSISMPYSQFLFSEAFLTSKLRELGVVDLGHRRDCLQHLNKWSLRDFEDLFEGVGLEIVSKTYTTDRSGLSWILRYPECFRGRGLNLTEVTTSGIKICLRKREL